MNHILIYFLVFVLTLGQTPVHAATYIKGGALIEEPTTVVSAGGTTTLTKDSNSFITVTGTTTQIIVLPSALTLPKGRHFEFVNQSSDIVTINASGGTAVKILGPTEKTKIRLTANTVAAGTWVADHTSSGIPPTITRLTSGSGTYVRPAGVVRLEIKMVGAGGGGAGSGTSGQTGGANGTATTFGTSLLSAGGGGGAGAGFAYGGAGGTATITPPAVGNAVIGGMGGAGSSTANASTAYLGGGSGGNSFYGGGASGGLENQGTGSAGAANTGGGGGGAGNTAGQSGNNNGAGGGAGAFIDASINSPAASYAYSIGTGGAGGNTGSFGGAGGAGGSGYIEIKEFYGSQPSTITTTATPTVTKLTSGSGVYTVPAGVGHLKIRMVGAGGGGSGSHNGASNAGNGGSPGATTFGGTLLVANGGVGGTQQGYGGEGGTATLGAGALGTANVGSKGQSWGGNASQTVYIRGGDGGQSPLGGRGVGGPPAGNGEAAKPNTGSGGGGGGSAAVANGVAGSGGGSGGYIEAVISGPALASSFAYTIAAGGAGGSSGSGGSPGGYGADGYIEITEFYSPKTEVRMDTTASLLGTTFYTGKNICPANSLPADGAAVSRVTYKALFGEISTTFGVGDGSTTFNVPDLRGVFVKGAGSQTIGSVTHSGTLGTKQGDQMQGHVHDVKTVGGGSSVGLSNNSSVLTPGLYSGLISSPVTDGTNGTPRTGTETRPANIAMTPCIWVVSQDAPKVVNGASSNFKFASIAGASGANVTSSSGTQTITFANATKFKVTLNTLTAHSQAYTFERTTWALGGTVTRDDFFGANPSVEGIEAQDSNVNSSIVIYGSATAGQTLTIGVAYQCNYTTAGHTNYSAYLLEYLP